MYLIFNRDRGVVLAAAAISDVLVNASTDFVADLGLAGIFVLMALDAACVPIPSEATMLFGGFTVGQGHNSIVSVTAAGVLGNLVGSWLAFWVGRYGRRWLDRPGRHRRLISRRHLAAADRWFERYGDASVLLARMVPIARTFISLPAGASRMSFARFTALTVTGCVPWVLGFTLLGNALGQNWGSLRGSLQYLDYGAALLTIAALGYLLVRRARRSA